MFPSLLPKLLVLAREDSGGHAADLLQSHGIEVLVDNPNVGENLQDHPLTGTCYEVVIQGAMTAYMTSREGPLTSGFHSAASIPVVECLTEPGRSELLKQPQSTISGAAVRVDPLDPREPGRGLCRDGHGRNPVPLRQGDAQGHLLHFGPVTTCASWCRWLTRSRAARCTSPPARRLCQAQVLPKGTDHVKRNTVTFNHPCGTCAMMSFDLGGVVDDRLRVYGVNGLRVVDASVFPMIPKGFIQSSVYAVAEKAADLIKEDYS
ncbi:GMC oxidoreductase-domain-containing protein [Lipomyces tetrasporus]